MTSYGTATKLAELYAERDRLRGKKSALESQLEALLKPLVKVQLEIGALEQGFRERGRSDLFSPPPPAPRTTVEDLPEYFGAILK